MSYSVFLIIHQISYMLWIASFFGSIYYFFKIRSSSSDYKPTMMRKERLVSSMGGHLGFLGIFISGGAMASLKSGAQMGWFDFANYSWLATKQVLFFVALVVIGALVMPASAKVKRLVNSGAELKEVEGTWNKAFFFSLLVYVIVLINTILGLQKSF